MRRSYSVGSATYRHARTLGEGNFVVRRCAASTRVGAGDFRLATTAVFFSPSIGEPATMGAKNPASQRARLPTDEDLEEHLDSGHVKWNNRVQWVRQRLIDAGDMSGPKHGVWEVTEQGRKRVAENGREPAKLPTPPASLVDIHEKYESQFRAKLRDKLYELSPTQFEHFAKELLTKYGFAKMQVTQVSSDGGIDGHGLLKVGLARMAVAFQCKRWQDNVPRTEVDKFRGVIQGTFAQGIFFTTSDFTSGAKDVSIKQGAVPIILLNGESIVDFMIDKEFGVKKRPLQIYDDQIESVFGDE